MRWTMVILLKLVLGGCSNAILGGGDLFEGASDYYIAGSGSALRYKYFAENDVLHANTENCKNSAPDIKKTGDTENQATPDANSCEALKGMQFIRKNDPMTIDLRRVVLHQITEGAIENILRSDDEVRGEIAVIANVMEGSKASKLSVENASSGMKEGRIVYYTEDARRHRALNFSSIPLYYVDKYDGNSVCIELAIIEIDEKENEKLKAILKTISDFGQNVPSPHAQFLPILNSIGSAIIKSNKDDVLFRYLFCLHPVGGRADLKAPYLAAGNYVIGRGTKKTSEFRWPCLEFDGAQGVLKIKDFKEKSESSKKSEKIQRYCDEFFKNRYGQNYRDNTYMTLQIGRNMPGDEIIQVVTLDTLRQRLSNAAKDDNITLQNALTNVAALLGKESQFREVKKALQRLEDSTSTMCRLDYENDADMIAKFLRCSILEADKPSAREGGCNTFGSESESFLTTDEIRYTLERISAFARHRRVGLPSLATLKTASGVTAITNVLLQQADPAARAQRGGNMVGNPLISDGTVSGNSCKPQAAVATGNLQAPAPSDDSPADPPG